MARCLPFVYKSHPAIDAIWYKRFRESNNELLDISHGISNILGNEEKNWLPFVDNTCQDKHN